MTSAILSSTAAGNDGRHENGMRGERTIVNDVFRPASAPGVVRESQWTVAGLAAPVIHPEFVSPIVARFLTDSALYLGMKTRNDGQRAERD